MRFFFSFVLGCVVVFAMLVTGLALFGVFDEQPPPGVRAFAVDELTPEDRRSLAELFGENKRPIAPRAAPELSANVTGFVQLEVSVADDGSVAGATVLGATPAGVYEDQALQDILQKRFPPVDSKGDDEPLRTVIEIVEFSVTDDR